MTNIAPPRLPLPIGTALISPALIHAALIHAALSSGCTPASPAEDLTTSEVGSSTETDSTTMTSTTTSTSNTTATTASSSTTELGLSWSVDETIGTLITLSFSSPTATEAYALYSFDEGVWMQTPTRSFDAGPAELLILGVPYDHEVQIQLVTTEATASIVTAATASHPEGMPIPEYVSGDSTLWWADGDYVFTSINADEYNWSGDEFWKVILDRQGRVVWALMTPQPRWTLWVDVAGDGQTLMWDENTVYDFGSGDPSYVHKMTIDGAIVETIEADGLHHAWDELADGSVIWGAQINGNEEWLQRRHTDGSVETIWRCSDFEIEQLGQTASRCHSNSWWWHEATDTYLVSFPSSAGSVRDTVLHLDATGQTIDTWGYLSDWTFEDPTTTFSYQHGVTFTDTGTLLLSTQLTAINPYYEPGYDTLAVREYVLDHDSRVLREVWAFGEDQGIAGKYNGEAHRLPNGSTLHNYGTGARLREITADGELVWDVKFQGGNTEGNGRLQGRSVFLTDLYDFAPAGD